MSQRALLVSDIHQKVSFLKDLDLFLSKNSFKYLISAGDLTNRSENAVKYAQDFFKIVEKRIKNIYVIHGNNEPKDVVDLYKRKDYSVHFNPKKIGRRYIVGIGGWGDTENKKIDKYLKDSVLVTHFPPKAAPCSFIDQPSIHISGHMHFSEARYKKNGILYIHLKSSSQFLRVGILDLAKEEIKFTNLD